MAKFGFNEWLAQQVRLTVFPVPTETQRQAGWWEQLVGESPNETTNNPKRGTAVVRGPWKGGTLTLGLEIERIDWVYTIAEEEAIHSNFLSIGSAQDAIAEFSQVAERWLAESGIPLVQRMAFGAVLFHLEDSKESSYQHLQDYLPIRVNANYSDFLLQINLPPVQSQTGIDGLRFNRLSRWSAALQKTFAMIPAIGVQDRASDVYATRVELDCNTVPTYYTAIPREHLGRVFAELVEAGVDVVTNGVSGEA